MLFLGYVIVQVMWLFRLWSFLDFHFLGYVIFQVIRFVRRRYLLAYAIFMLYVVGYLFLYSLCSRAGYVIFRLYDFFGCSFLHFLMWYFQAIFFKSYVMFYVILVFKVMLFLVYDIVQLMLFFKIILFVRLLYFYAVLGYIFCYACLWYVCYVFVMLSFWLCYCM